MSKTIIGVYRLAQLLICCMSAGGCANRQSIGIEYCANSRAIWVDEADYFTDSTAVQILEHNEIGRRLCGWQR